MLRESSVFQRINWCLGLWIVQHSLVTKPDLPDAFWSWVLVEQNDAVADA